MHTWHGLCSRLHSRSWCYPRCERQKFWPPHRALSRGSSVLRSPLPPRPVCRVEALESSALAPFSTPWTHTPLAALTRAVTPKTTVPHSSAPRSRAPPHAPAPAHSEYRRPKLGLPARRTAFPRSHRDPIPPPALGPFPVSEQLWSLRGE